MAGTDGTSTRESPGRESSGSRHALVRREVLHAAADLFAERGFAGTNLQDIAEAVGLSRPALYHYFKNKTAVFEGLVEDVTLTAAARLEEVLDRRDRSAQQRLREAVNTWVDWILERSTLFRLVDRSEAELPAPLRETHEAGKRRVLRAMMQMIDDGIAAGEFRPVDTRVTALSFIGMCNWVAWWYSPADENGANIAETIAGLAVSSIARDDGREGRYAGLQGALALLREDLSYLEGQLPPDETK